MSSGAVLIVDDDNDVRSALAELLEEEGFSVEGAANGREALALLRGGTVHPAVILLDLMMPGMDGWDFRHEQMRDPKLAARAGGDRQRVGLQPRIDPHAVPTGGLRRKADRTDRVARRDPRV